MLIQNPVTAKTMYKWVDENGKVTFSDQIPPSEIERERETIDRNAQVIKVIPKAKTKEQIAMDKRLHSLRKQQKKLIQAQKNKDKVLQSNFRNLSDMKATYNKKLLALDAKKQVLDNMLKRKQEYLKQQQSKVAELEIKNKKVSNEILTNITETKTEIKQIQADINQKVSGKKSIATEFNANIERFKFLMASKNNPKTTQVKQTETEKAVDKLGLFNCKSDSECQQAWKASRKFVLNHSNTKISIDTAQLLMTQVPNTPTQLSLSVSKSKEEDSNKYQIFLDISCENSPAGQALCLSSKAVQLRASFNPIIKRSLNIGTP